MKEKGKFNPFASVLRPDEEILWFDRRFPHHAQSQELMSNVFVVSLIMALSAAFVMFLISQSKSDSISAALVSGGMCFGMNLGCMLMILVPLEVGSALVSKSPAPTTYALTNRRWLRYADKVITGVLLEDIPLFEYTKGVMRLDLPDLQTLGAQENEVRELMGQARKDCLKMLSEVHTQ